MTLSSAFYPQGQMGFAAWGGGWQAGGMGMGMQGMQGMGGMWGMQGMQGMRMDMVAFSFVMQPMYMQGGMAASRITEDPYGVAQSGQGMRSNLANSPEVMLALNDIFKQGGVSSYEDVAKKLKDDYGIQAEVGDVKSVGKDGKELSAKGLKFGNGDFFVDGNGDNILTSADYKFDDAVKNLKDKYGLGDQDLKGIVENMKTRASHQKDFGGGQMHPMMGMNGMQGLSGMQGMGGQFGMGMGMFGPWANMQWMMMFSRAFQMAA